MTAPLYTPIESNDGMTFRIDSGYFAGVVYQYGVVSLKEPIEDGDQLATLSFTYKLIHDPTGEAENGENFIDFQITMGDILSEIIAGGPEYIEDIDEEL